MNGKKYLIVFFTLLAFFTILTILPKTKTAKSQKMNELNYNITLNEDGSMNVIETWDIYVKNTGTLFRTFDDFNEYQISDVEVVDLTTNNKLNSISRKMQDVPEGQYYGLQTGYDSFEIAWGTGKNTTKGNLKYQISYKVNNVITSYNDCQELYWKLLDTSNGIPCKKITGNIKLYKPVSDIDNLKVWGHGPIDGTIQRVSNDTIEFNINNFSSGTMLEIRTVVTDKIFNTLKVEDRTVLNDLLEEENLLAIETDNEKNFWNMVNIAILVIEGIILLYGLFKIIKYSYFGNEDNDGINYKGIEYFREIPREDTATPGEAIYLYNMFAGKDKTTSIIASYILNLSIKGCIDIQERNGEMFIKILGIPENLKEDEKIVLEIINKVALGANEINIKELNKFSKKHSREFKEYVESIIDSVEYNLKKENLIERNEEALRRNVKKESVLYYGFLFALIVPFAIQFVNLLLYITIPLFIIEMVIISKVRNKANKLFKLTQTGAYEAEEWNGLKNYLKDYSLIEEKDVFDIKLWEKYLVFATALGISKQVVNSLKAKYPDLFTEKYWDINGNTSTILNMVCNPIYVRSNCNFINFTHGMTTHNISIHTYTINFHSSSNYGGGGGSFSSGGGGRRWPVAGMGGR